MEEERKLLEIKEPDFYSFFLRSLCKEAAEYE
jgi:hypothetical protein